MKGGGGGGGGAILGTGLLVAGGPVEGSPWVSGVEAMEEEVEEDEGVDVGLAGGHEEVHDLVGEGFGWIPLVWRGGGSRGKPPHNSEMRSSTNFPREAPLWWWW